MGVKSIIILFNVIKKLGLRSFIKTIRFNIYYFGIKKGSRLPIFISKNVHFNKMQGKIIIDTMNTGHIRIGFGDVGVFDKKYDRTVISFSKGSTIIFRGNCNIGHGTKISVQNNAELSFGKYFCVTANSTIICTKKIIFGNNVLISWDVQIMDTDFHKIYKEGVLLNPDEEIIIGDDVWINSRVVILKGCEIPQGCVVGAMTLCNKKYDVINSILVGPSGIRYINNGILWRS